MTVIKKVGNIYSSDGQNGCIYDIDGISPSISSGTTDNPRNGGIGSNNAPKVLIKNNPSKGSGNLTKLNEIKVDDIFEGKPFNYVSLFSGIGGFEQALNKLGGTCVLSSEIDKFANQAYEVLYGEPTAGDITQIDAKDVPDHDLLVGGFPYN